MLPESFNFGLRGECEVVDCRLCFHSCYCSAEEFRDAALTHQQREAEKQHTRPKPSPHERRDGDPRFYVTGYNLTASCVTHGHI